ncbi:MAG: M6 family metalloprotease domain-containing protein [Prevotella sp.]|jgi:M6 family metalloprotease-like protein
MQHIFKTLIAALLLTLSAAPASAIPAYPGKMNALQANGSVIAIQKLGDEYCHITVTTDGYPLVFNQSTRNYEYASLHQGKLVASGIVATQPQQRSAEAKQFLATVDKSEVMAQFEANHSASLRKANAMRRSPSANKIRINNVPTLGTHDVLVILVQFADTKFSTMSDPVAYYDKFFHEEGFSENGAKGSVYDFYRYGSNNSYDPQFKVYGPVTVSGNASTYAGANGSSLTYKLIQEAVPLVDSLYNVDFSTFDTDGDGKVDNVYCIYAGYGQADSGLSDVIWPHSSNLNNSQGDRSFQVDGVTIDRYTVSQEINGTSKKTVGIGTFCHEFGHVLGLADHYNTSNSSSTNQPGQWDLMAAGSYNDDQNCPPTFSAFERYSLGWGTLTQLSTNTDTLVDIAPYEDSGFAYRVSVPGSVSEYFIIENRQQKSWDEYLPGHGMLVWHIDEDQTVWDNNMVNADANHQHVDIVEAGRMPSYDGSASDVFPGTRDVTAYNFTSWNYKTVFGFAWLREVGEQAQFILSNTDYRLPSPEVNVTNIMGTSATVEWGESELADGYYAAVTLNGVVLDSIVTEAPGTLDVEGLQPETEYIAKVVSTLSSLRSDTVEVAFTTLPLQIEERKPEGLFPTDYTETAFTACWQPVNDADEYEVTLLKRTHDGVGSYGTGFDNYTKSEPNFPEGWRITELGSGYTKHYGEASPSIRLRGDSSMLICCVPNHKVEKVSFWHRASKAGLQLSLDKFVDGAWSNVWFYQADVASNLTDEVEVGEADSIRFVLTRESEDVTGGYLFLDDIYLTYLYDQYAQLRQATVSSDEALQGGKSFCMYTFTGLDSNLQYAFTVQAFSGSRESMVSDTVNVDETTVIDHVNGVTATQEGPVAVYNLQGCRVATLPAGSKLDAVLPRGVYIVRGKKVVVK